MLSSRGTIATQSLGGGAEHVPVVPYHCLDQILTTVPAVSEELGWIRFRLGHDFRIGRHFTPRHAAGTFELCTSSD
jgi:hypothetical protein